jgi:hypothetical protein
MAIQAKGNCICYLTTILIASVYRLAQLFELAFGSDTKDPAIIADTILLHGEAGVGKFYI